jgi:hypothetical protein
MIHDMKPNMAGHRSFVALGQSVVTSGNLANYGDTCKHVARALLTPQGIEK